MQLRQLTASVNDRNKSEHSQLAGQLASLLVKLHSQLAGARAFFFGRHWRRVILTTSMQFQVCTSTESMFFKGVNLRNSIIDEFEALTRTACQRTYELMTFKMAREQTQCKMSASDLWQAWSQHVTQSTAVCAETVSQNFVDTALKFHDRILSTNRLRNLVLAMDSEYGKLSPVSLMSNVAKIMEKTRNPEQLHWVLSTIQDLLATNECSPKDFTVRSLVS